MSGFFLVQNGLKKLTISQNNKIKYSEYPLQDLTGSKNSLVYGVCMDKDHNIWVSTENDLRKINITEKKVFIVKQNNPDPENDITKTVFNIFCDKNNRIWLGGIDGFSYITNPELPFQAVSHSLTSDDKINHAYFISPQSDSVAYICAEDGLYKSNFKKQSISTIDNSKSYDYFFTDINKRKIISNSSSLFCLENEKRIPIEKIYSEFKSVVPIRINSHIFLNDSCIAMGTEDHKGIIIWNYKSKKIEHFNTASIKGRLGEDIINSIYLLGNEKILILGEKFLSLFDYSTKNVQILNKLKFPNKSYSLFFDFCKIQKKYYLASYGNGVVVFDEGLNLSGEISTINGLSNNGVYKLLPWKDSLLFITTNNGLNIYNVNSHVIRQYYKTDGLHGDAFEETSGYVYNNNLFAGGAKGFSIIHPENIKTNYFPPIIYFTKISTKTANDEQSDTSNLEAKYFSIPNNVVQAIIYFSGINYSNNERTTFSYRIVEQNSNWISISTQNFIPLINHSPGTYHLQVKAANEDGIWSAPKELVLEFLPKWYQTWWFKLLVLLTTAGIIYSFYRYRIRQIKKQHEIRKNIATDLHDDLGSTLNSVKVFTNLAISGVKQEESLQQIKDNLNEATTGLRDMIWVLDDSLDTVDELVTRLKQFAIPVASASDIEANIQADTHANDTRLSKEEKRNLFLVCKEAINNSIKYSGATQINVSIIREGKKIKISITDNGKGFDIEKIKKGYGLKNMQYRATQVKFKLTVNTAEGKGTKIEIFPF